MKRVYNILSLLVGRFSRKTKTINDAHIGKIKFASFRGPSIRLEIWDGDLYFHPTGSNINISIYAGADGPSIKQREFLKQIEWKYNEIIKNIEIFFIQNIGTSGTIINSINLKDDYLLSSITINRSDVNEIISWSIDYENKLNKNILLSVSLVLFEVERLSLEIESDSK